MLVELSKGALATKIAFLGLGRMGGYMAANLARSFPVAGWNRTQDRPGVDEAIRSGVQFQPSIPAAATAQIIVSCVSDVQDVEAVLLGEQGAANFAQPGTLFIDTSTIGPQAARQIGEKLNARGFRFIDAPVSGGDIGAKNGTLTFMVGGSLEDYATALPILQTMGRNIYHCGPVGAGQSVKLANQVLCAGNTLAVSEALYFAQFLGIDPALVVEICSTGAAASWALANLGPKQCANDFAPGFAIDHLRKDLRLTKEAVAGQSTPLLPMTELADLVLAHVAALDQGTGGKQGTQAMILAYKENK